MCLLLALACGCSMFSGSTSKKQSLEATERISAARDATLRKVTEGEKAMPYSFDVGGKNNKLEIHFPPQTPRRTPFREELSYDEESAESAGSWTSLMSKYKHSIPLGLSLMLVAIGILMLIFAVKRLRQSSVAANAAFGVADSVLERQLSSIGQKMAASISSQDNAALAAEMAGLEKQRGKLAAAKPK